MLQAEQILQERYQLQEKLGRTAAGRQTWLAKDLQSNEQAIVKLLAFSPQMQWDELKLFEREAQVLANLNHAQIPRYRDYFSIDREAGAGLPWFGIVQDYIPGASLQELLEKGKRFTETEVRKIATQVLDILIYLHELSPPVLHRDIKPSNLILGEDKQVYLVDFGAVQDKAALTGVTFTVVGTSGYAPLEQFWGRAVPASDLYALGATLIHLLTGIAPVDLPQKDSRIQFSDRANVSSDFVAWIEKLTETAIEKRFATAKQAFAALESGLSFTSLASNPARKIPKPPHTLIKINKSTERLEIQIPTGGLRKFEIVDFFNTIILLIPMSFLLFIFILFNFVFLILLLIFLGGLAVVSVIFVDEKTNVCFDRHSFGSFEILRQRGEFDLSRQKGNISDILGIFLRSKGSLFEICINSDNKIYPLGGALSEAESIWLAQEIQDWFNFK